MTQLNSVSRFFCSCMAITWVVIASAAAVAAEAERPETWCSSCATISAGVTSASTAARRSARRTSTRWRPPACGSNASMPRRRSAAPPRGSCLTGRHPYRYGIRFANVGHMQPAELTLAELLARQGYATGHFGKMAPGDAHQKPNSTRTAAARAAWPTTRRRGTTVSRPAFLRRPRSPPGIRCCAPPATSPGRGGTPVTDDSQAELFGTAYWSNGKRVNEPLRGDDSKLIVDRASAVHSRGGRRRPAVFSRSCGSTHPHLPVVAGPRHAAMYAEHEPYHQHYYGCVTALDEQVGRLRGELRQLDVADDTLVFFCSDNGPEGNQKAPGTTGGLRGRKRSLWEGGIRVPGLVEWPARIPPASKTIVPACTSDYLPTILDILNVTRDDARPLDGVSLLPLLAGDQEQRGTARSASSHPAAPRWWATATKSSPAPT